LQTPRNRGFLDSRRFRLNTPIPALGPISLERAHRFAGIRPESFRRTGSCRQSGGLLSALETSIAPGRRRLLDEIAPERIRLRAAGHAARALRSRPPPSVASRLQDFFGMSQTPPWPVARSSGAAAAGPQSAPGADTQRLGRLLAALYPQVRKDWPAVIPNTPGPRPPRLTPRSTIPGPGPPLPPPSVIYSLSRNHMPHFVNHAQSPHSALAPRAGREQREWRPPRTRRSRGWPILLDARGYRGGSPLEDWFRAERVLTSHDS